MRTNRTSARGEVERRGGAAPAQCGSAGRKRRSRTRRGQRGAPASAAASPGSPGSPRPRRRHVPHTLRVRPVSAPPPPLSRGLPAASGLRLSHGPAAGPAPGGLSPAAAAGPLGGAAGGAAALLGLTQEPLLVFLPGLLRVPAWPGAGAAAGFTSPRPLSLIFYLMWVLENLVRLNTGEGRARPYEQGRAPVPWCWGWLRVGPRGVHRAGAQLLKRLLKAGGV